MSTIHHSPLTTRRRRSGFGAQAAHHSQHALHLLTLAVITVAFFWQPIFTDETFFFRDLWRYYYPVRLVSVEQIHSGQIPFWNPYSSCGYPLLGALTLGIFYPLALLFVLLPFGLAFKHYIILHYFLAAVFAYALAVEWGLSAAAALFTALAFAFSGYFISLHSGFCYLASAVWMPLVVLLFHRTLSRRSVGYAVLTGMALACQFLAGEAGTVLHTGLILAGYFGFFAFKGAATDNGLNVQPSTFNVQRSTPAIANRKSQIANAPPLIALLLVLAFTSAGLAMAQFLPSWELGGQSTRGGGYSLDMSAEASFMLAHLPTIIAPFLFGNVYNSWWGGLFRVRDPFYNCIYLGLLPVVMACAALALVRRRLTIFLAVVALLGLLLSLGTLTPLFYLFWKFVPMARMFRYPQKLFALTAFATPFLAGLAFDRLSAMATPSARTLRRTLGGVGISLGLLWIAVAALYGAGDWLRDALVVDRPKMQGDVLAQIAYDHFAASAFKAVVGLTLALAFVMAVVSGRLAGGRFRLMALLFLIGDLFWAGSQAIVTLPASFYAPRRSQPGLAALYGPVFTEDSRNHRIEYFDEERILYFAYQRYGYDVRDNTHRLWRVLTANSGMTDHLSYALGYESSMLRSLTDFMAIASGCKDHLSPFLCFEPIETHAHRFPFVMRAYGLLATKYLITRPDPEALPFTAGRDPSAPMRAVEWEEYLPRARVVTRAVPAGSRAEAVGRVFSKSFQPAREAVVEGASAEALRGLNGEPPAAPPRIAHDGAHRVLLETFLAAPGLAVLADVFYPGWRAFDNGVEQRIHRVYGLTRGVLLTPGPHRVQFVYDGQSFRLGLVLSLAAAAALLTWAAARTVSLRRK